MIRHAVVMWGDLIRSVDATATFREPAAEAALRACEQALGHPLAADLAELLRESDGVQLTDRTSIWPVARIAQVNAEMRTGAEWSRIHMSFAPLAFFADPGTADMFAYLPHRVADGRTDVFRWDHRNDGRVWAADGVQRLIEWSVGA